MRKPHHSILIQNEKQPFVEAAAKVREEPFADTAPMPGIKGKARLVRTFPVDPLYSGRHSFSDQRFVNHTAKVPGEPDLCIRDFRSERTQHTNRRDGTIFGAAKQRGKRPFMEVAAWTECQIYRSRTIQTCSTAAFVHAENPCTCSTIHSAVLQKSPSRPLKFAAGSAIQSDCSPRLIYRVPI